ncbi:hypothetical protein PCE1_002026 [Barthelona sp. PCE]
MSEESHEETRVAEEPQNALLDLDAIMSEAVQKFENLSKSVDPIFIEDDNNEPTYLRETLQSRQKSRESNRSARSINSVPAKKPVHLTKKGKKVEKKVRPTMSEIEEGQKVLNRMKTRWEVLRPIEPPKFDIVPSRIDFKDYLVNSNYIYPVTITNTSGQMHSLRIIPPGSPFFGIQNIKYASNTDGRLAPGMSMEFEVVLYRKDRAQDNDWDVSDVVEIKTLSDTITIPLRAYRPPTTCSVLLPKNHVLNAAVHNTLTAKLCFETASLLEQTILLDVSSDHATVEFSPQEFVIDESQEIDVELKIHFHKIGEHTLNFAFLNVDAIFETIQSFKVQALMHHLQFENKKLDLSLSKNIIAGESFDIDVPIVAGTDLPLVLKPEMIIRESSGFAFKPLKEIVFNRSGTKQFSIGGTISALRSFDLDVCFHMTSSVGSFSLSKLLVLHISFNVTIPKVSLVTNTLYFNDIYTGSMAQKNISIRNDSTVSLTMKCELQGLSTDTIVGSIRSSVKLGPSRTIRIPVEVVPMICGHSFVNVHLTTSTNQEFDVPVIVCAMAPTLVTSPGVIDFGIIPATFSESAYEASIDLAATTSLAIDDVALDPAARLSDRISFELHDHPDVTRLVTRLTVGSQPEHIDTYVEVPLGAGMVPIRLVGSVVRPIVTMDPIMNSFELYEGASEMVNVIVSIETPVDVELEWQMAEITEDNFDVEIIPDKFILGPDKLSQNVSFVVRGADSFSHNNVQQLQASLYSHTYPLLKECGVSLNVHLAPPLVAIREGKPERVPSPASFDSLSMFTLEGRSSSRPVSGEPQSLRMKTRSELGLSIDTLDFGVVRLSQPATKHIALHNFGPVDVEFTFDAEYLIAKEVKASKRNRRTMLKSTRVKEAKHKMFKKIETPWCVEMIDTVVVPTCKTIMVEVKYVQFVPGDFSVPLHISNKTGSFNETVSLKASVVENVVTLQPSALGLDVKHNTLLWNNVMPSVNTSPVRRTLTFVNACNLPVAVKWYITESNQPMVTTRLTPNGLSLEPWHPSHAESGSSSGFSLEALEQTFVANQKNKVPVLFDVTKTDANKAVHEAALIGVTELEIDGKIVPLRAIELKLRAVVKIPRVTFDERQVLRFTSLLDTEFKQEVRTMRIANPSTFPVTFDLDCEGPLNILSVEKPTGLLGPSSIQLQPLEACIVTLQPCLTPQTIGNYAYKALHRIEAGLVVQFNKTSVKQQLPCVIHVVEPEATVHNVDFGTMEVGTIHKLPLIPAVHNEIAVHWRVSPEPVESDFIQFTDTKGVMSGIAIAEKADVVGLLSMPTRSPRSNFHRSLGVTMITCSPEEAVGDFSYDFDFVVTNGLKEQVHKFVVSGNVVL